MLAKSLTICLIFSASVRASEIVGKIADIELTTEEAKQLVLSLGESAEAPADLSPEATDRIVRAVLVQRLVLREAEAAKHGDNPAVAARILRAQQAALAESYLQSVSSPPSNYPSETDLSEAYETNKAAFIIPKSWHLAQIFISAPAGPQNEDTEKRLESVLKQLAEPNADFSSIARVSSDDRNSSASGGDLGWLQENMIQPAIREALPALKLNGISKPIRLEDGYHIIRLIDAKEASTPTLDQIKPQLKARLRAQKAQQNRQEWLTALLEKNPPAINGIELLKLKETSPAKPTP
jgi:parvulin-like peptidyl-prolyl isomerase